MAIQRGDEVRFLNDVGGGVVARIVGDTAYVEDADGFEIPAKLTQIVLVKKSEANTPSTPQNTKAKHLGVAQVQPKSVEDQVYLAFLPADKSVSASGDVRVYIVNSTNCTICVVGALQGKSEGQFSFWFQQNVDPTGVLGVDKLPIKLLDGQGVHLQVIFYQNNRPFVPIQPLSLELKIRPSKLVRESSFAQTPYFSEKAMMLPLMKKQLDEKIELLQQKIKQEHESAQTSPKQSTKLPKPGDIIETDLHINELMDDTRGLSNGEMLKIQLDKFEKTIEEYKAIKGLKLVFIHGVGNGVLKQELLKLLKTKYKRYYYQDASFKEYGYGATMVTI